MGSVYGGGYYPPGTPPPRDMGIELRCMERSCEMFGVVIEVPAYWELGGTFLRDEDDGFCPECRSELADA